MKRDLSWYWYATVQALCRAVFPACFQLRVLGRRHLPLSGGVLLVSNHQSFLDPVLVALALPRHVRYLARQTLFRAPGFRWLIRSLGATPIHREGIGVRGIRASLEILKRGDVLLLFPEGTRTRDGRIGPMRGGLGLLARKAGVPIVPVAIRGAFEAWPRTQKLPRLRPIRVALGEALWPAEAAGMEPRKVAEAVRQRVVGCYGSLAEKIE